MGSHFLSSSTSSITEYLPLLNPNGHAHAQWVLVPVLPASLVLVELSFGHLRLGLGTGSLPVRIREQEGFFDLSPSHVKIIFCTRRSTLTLCVLRPFIFVDGSIQYVDARGRRNHRSPIFTSKHRNANQKKKEKRRKKKKGNGSGDSEAL